MKKLFILFAILIAACASTTPVVNPTPPTPAPIPVTPQDTVHIHDTTTIVKLDILLRIDTITRIMDIILADTALPFIVLSPDPSGDSYLMLQTAINNYINRMGPRIILSPGQYVISHPLIVAKIVNGDYVQVSLDMEGPAFAKNTPAAYMATIIPAYPDGFTLGIQKGKGCQIKNIAFVGPFTLPATFNETQIDTLPLSAWNDGKISVNRTSPTAGIVIDPFSDPVNYDSVIYRMYNRLHQWYLAGMSSGGSTAIQIPGCSFDGFAVGIMITPSDQQNGEEIDVTDPSFQHCISGYAWSQAQSKANTVTQTQAWGGVRTVFDGNHWGFQHDANNCPMIDVANIAGINYQLISASSYTFPITIKRVYAESLFKIGLAGGFAGTTFEDCDFELQHDPGMPSPDFTYQGPNTSWIGGQVRYYGYPDARVVMNSATNLFVGGAFGTEPIVQPVHPINAPMNPALFLNTTMYYSAANLTGPGTYDSAGQTHIITLHVDPGFVGWYIGKADEETGDVILTQKNFQDSLSTYLGTGVAVPVGNVYNIAGDTVLLGWVGAGMHDGDVLTVRAAKYKAGFKP